MSARSTTLRYEYVPASVLPTYPHSSQLLGAIVFGAPAASASNDPSLPLLQVEAALPAAQAASCELWASSGPVVADSCGELHYRHDQAAVFGCLRIDPAVGLQQAAAQAYTQIFSLLESLGYAHLYRCWNYMGDINLAQDGLERYQQFNTGRQHAFLGAGRDIASLLPAACALGLRQGPLSVAFLAGRQPAQPVENPRQVSAFRYPPRYGSSSPTFSRATLLRQPDDALLLISGTASIVGHETRHEDDVRAQTAETLANLGTLVQEANGHLKQALLQLRQAQLRVYVRDAADWPLIDLEIRRQLGASVQVVYVQADICRSDLLLEIEANLSAPLKQVAA